MKTFPTLYKRTKTSAIQYWKIGVTPCDALCDPSILKESGQLDTISPIKHSERILEGKQKRTVTEQAEFQAESDWKKKRDEGYKSLDDLYIDETEFSNGIHRKIIKEDGGPVTLEMMLRQHLPQFNTDSSGNVKPMLATDWKKIKKIEYPCFCEPKLDGVRCLMIVDPQASEELVVTFLSRSGKKYSSLGHINYAIMNYLSTAPRYPDKFILDGEIYSDELNFQEIVSAVKAYKSNSEKLHFRVYDIVNDDIMTERRNNLKYLVESIGSEFIQTITWNVATCEEDVKASHDFFVQSGYEGAMLRMFDGKYGQGQRSRELLKVKEFDETEYQITHFELGQRGVEDLLAVCVLKPNGADPRTFKAKMVGNRKQKAEIFEYNGKVGMQLTVKHFGLTEEGIPRFPVGKSIRDYD